MSQVISFHQSKVKFAGRTTTLSALKFSISDESEFSGDYHEVNLLDRSGSMWGSLDHAVDTLIRRAKAIKSADGYLSVGWFSSQGHCSMILKGVKVTDRVIKDLDKLRTTIGATCFSEILIQTSELLVELNKLADLSVVNLLTDGQAVVCDYKKELATSLDAAKLISERAVAINTIGFGNYYNREFLVNLSQHSQYGRFVHVDDVRDSYFDALELLSEEVTGSLTNKLKINTGVPSTLIYADGKVNVQYDADGEFEFRNLNSGSVDHTIYILSDDTPPAVNLFVDDELLVGQRGAAIPEKDKLPALYALAWDYYLNRNDRKTAFEIAKNNIKDKHIATLIASGFTYSEVGNVSDTLYRAASGDELIRYQDGKCGPSFMPSSSFTSVFDVLQTLSDQNVTLIPFHDVKVSSKMDAAREKFTSEYKRTTRKVTDSENVFTKNPGGTKSPLNALVFSEDRLNINVRFTIDGTIKLNHQSAKRVGLDQTHPAFLWRNFSIVKDGQLNTPVIEILTNADQDDLRMELQGINDKYRGFIRYSESTADGEVFFILDLNKIPFVRSNTLEEISASELVDRTVRINDLEVKQKAIKIVIDENQSKTTAVQKVGQFKSLTKEQIQVLTDHGIRHDGSYSGVHNEAPKVGDLDSYETREVYTYVSGFSSLPSANAIQKKLDSGKKLTTSEQAVHDALVEVRKSIGTKKPAAAVKFLTEQLQGVRRELLTIRKELSMIKLTTLLNNAWFSSIVLDEKDSANLGQNVVLKAKRVTEYV